MTNSELMAASVALSALSKIGTKDRDMLKRLAKIIMWVNKTLEEFFVQRDTLLNTWAERDDNGEIKTEQDSKNPVMRNAAEYQLAANELLRGQATYDGEPPAPFSWEEIVAKFQKLPDAQVLANLGPFIKLDKE